MGQCHSLGETLELWQTDGVILQYAGLMMLMMLMLIMFVDVHDVVDVDVDIDVWMMEWLQNQRKLQQHPTNIMLSILNKALCYVQQWRSSLDVVVVLVVVVVVVFLHIRADSGGNRGRACCCWQQWCCCFCCCTRKFRLHTHTRFMNFFAGRTTSSRFSVSTLCLF